MKKRVYDFGALYHLLDEDVMLAEKLLAGNDSQFARRVYARAICAYIEGTCFEVKTFTLRNFHNSMSQIEIDKLREFSFGHSEAEGFKLKKLRIDTTENIILAFTSMSKAMGIDNPLAAKSEEMTLIEKAFLIRHRLMHPKSPDGLKISDDELHTLDYVHSIFLGLYRDLVVQASRRFGSEPHKYN